MDRRIFSALLTLLCVVHLSIGVANAADKILSLVSSNSGLSTIAVSEGEPIAIEVRIDDASAVAGASFTVTYDTANLTLTNVESDFFGTFVSQSIPTPSDQGYVTVDNTNYYSPIVDNSVDGLSGAVTTGSMIAAARVDNGTGENVPLFTLHFTLNGNVGTYPISVIQSTINNVKAGYSASGELIPFLVGIGDSDTYPSHTVSTVHPASLVISPVSTDTKTVVLTNSSLPLTIAADNYTLVYGTSGTDEIILERGALAKLLNAAGNNIITIQSDFNLFSVSRSGATVTFRGTDGTMLSIPATSTPQSIVFDDDVSYELVINDKKVFLGAEEVLLDGHQVLQGDRILLSGRAIDSVGIDVGIDVVFPDPALEAVIREAINKKNGDILASDLLQITWLYAGSKNITNLSGFEYCSNLYYADLSYNQISDISPLKNLANLTDLNLSYNPLNTNSCTYYIPQHEANGVEVIDSCDVIPSDRVTIYFEGTVKSTGDFGVEVPTFNIGDKFWGTYNLDLNVSDSIPDDASVGHYFGAISNLNINVGTYIASSSEVYPLQVGNDYQSSEDYYNLTWGDTNGPDVNGWRLKDFTLQLVDPTKSALSSDEIPISPPDPKDFVSLKTFLSLGFENKSLGYSSYIVADFEQHYISMALPDNSGDVSTVTSAGQVWMDRNLGASRVATSSTDVDAYGDLYQWGRGTDGHEKRNSSTTTTLSSSDDPGHDSFIMSPDFPYDWRTPQNDTLWQGVNGTNNPCPPGFRLPTTTELDVERTSWSSNNSNGTFASPLKLVLAGYRDLNGTLYNAGNGYYWSNTVLRELSRNLSLYSDSGYAEMNGNDRGSGFSVRCLKD